MKTRVLSIKQKIWLGLSLMIVGYSLSVLFGFWSSQRTQVRLSDVSEMVFPAVRQSQMALSDFNQGLKAYEDAVVLSDLSLVEHGDAKFTDAEHALQEVVALIGFAPQKKAELENTLKQLTAFHQAAQTVYSQMANLETLDETGASAENQAADLNQQAQQLKRTLQGVMNSLADDLKTELQSISQLTRQQCYLNLFIFGILVGSTTFFVSLILRRSVIQPIEEAILFSNTIAGGDFTVRMQPRSSDELGRLLIGLSRMAEQLSTLVGQVQQTGIKVSSSVAELSAAGKQQEVTITSQLCSTSEVVKAVEKIAHIATDLVHTMQQVAEMSQTTADFASTGQTDLARMEEAMSRMENASIGISARLGTINEKAENITTVVTTINKVADHTNLLSLNAAIEAEKAGEFGRGFTVVAREIRRLADQTAIATLDIAQMVKEMQSAVAAGVMEMDKFVAEVRQSAADVDKISRQLTNIIEQVQTLSPRFDDVNAAMVRQSEYAQNIHHAMTHLNEEMQQTTDSFKESFIALDLLNEAARDLQSGVSRFKVK